MTAGPGYFPRLKELLGNLTQSHEPAIPELLEILPDPEVMQTITAQQVIIRPAADYIALFVPRRCL